MQIRLHHALFTALGIVLFFSTTIMVYSAPAYKLSVRGPGIADELTVWLAADKDLLWTMHGGLLTEQHIEPPNSLIPVYELTWFFGACWTTATPCTTDPAFTRHHTRYVFDAQRQQGMISHIDQPAWFDHPPQDNTAWYQTSSEFDRAVQHMFVQNGIIPSSLPATGIEAIRPQIKLSYALVAITALVLGSTLIQRRRHG